MLAAAFLGAFAFFGALVALLRAFFSGLAAALFEDVLAGAAADPPLAAFFFGAAAFFLGVLGLALPAALGLAAAFALGFAAAIKNTREK